MKRHKADFVTTGLKRKNGGRREQSFSCEWNRQIGMERREIMNSNGHFDLVILGSGSTAFAAALRAQELGKTSVMTEERTTGGTCVNRGCLRWLHLHPPNAARLLRRDDSSVHEG